MFRPNVQRLSFDQAAQWRRSMRDAREMAADGVLDAADLLRYWGRCAWASPSPRCVWKRRRERAAQRWSAFVAEMAELPPPTPKDNPYSPFSNGTQWMDWQGSNCCRCAKYRPDALEQSDACDLEWTLSVGGETGDGSVSEQTARRCGYLKADGSEDSGYVWPCAEVVWTEEWKAEYRRREGQQ